MKKVQICFEYLCNILKLKIYFFIGIVILFFILINSELCYSISNDWMHAVPTPDNWVDMGVNRNVSLASDGTNLYYASGSPRGAGPYLCKIPSGSSSSEDWTSLHRFPNLTSSEMDGGPDGIFYWKGYIYGSACVGSTWRSIIRYNISEDDWEISNGAEGANAATVIDDADNVFGFWKGYYMLEKVTNWWNMTEEWQGILGENAATHAVASTRDLDKLYFVRQSRYASRAYIYQIPADGTAIPGDIERLTTVPFGVGLGCAIEYVSADISSSGDDE